jgi:IclR family acetate operon transcriptional repressor
VLGVLEAIAAHQPVGVSGLARLLDDDKNAVQRAIVTLAETGWIAPAPGPAKGWELTAHIFAVAYMSHSKNDLRLRAKAELDALRNETGETVLLNVPDLHRFIVADVFESRQILRTAPIIGTIASARNSATGLAVVPFLGKERQAVMLGGPPDEALLDKFRHTLQFGYAVSVDSPSQGITSIAAPIFDMDGTPLGAVVVIGPTERLTPGRYKGVGALVVKAARNLSRGAPGAAPRATRPRLSLGGTAIEP